MNPSDPPRGNFSARFFPGPSFPGVPFRAPGPVESSPPPKEKEPIRFDLKPREIKRHLDRFIIGQDEAKKVLAVAVCDHYNHIRQLQEDRAPANYQKPNILMLGPTGVGKTYLVRCLAELIGVPFVKADATKFSETGYVGQDTDELIRSLVQQAGGDVELAQCGMIYLDEVDKIAGSGEFSGRDVSGRGVQTNLLKLMEDTDVPLRSPNDIRGQLEMAMEMARGGGSSGSQTINTRTILFICSGAFAGLPDIIRRRVHSGSMGFRAHGTEESSDSAEALEHLSTQDLIKYGFESEFAGRLPVRVACRGLSSADMEKILLESEGSILKQYEAAFRAYDIVIKFDREVIRRIAGEAAQEGTGARGLVSVLEKLLRDLKFELPSTRIREVTITPDFMDSPEEAKRRLLERARKLDIEGQAALMEDFARWFQKEHGLEVTFSDEASSELATKASEANLPLLEFCRDHFHDFPYGLKLIQGQTGQSTFKIELETTRDPKGTLSRWVVESYRGGS
jgi:endopeptidase Clp ATP-binding regulatory subunit ClpX